MHPFVGKVVEAMLRFHFLRKVALVDLDSAMRRQLDFESLEHRLLLDATNIGVVDTDKFGPPDWKLRVSEELEFNQVFRGTLSDGGRPIAGRWASPDKYFLGRVDVSGDSLVWHFSGVRSNLFPTFWGSREDIPIVGDWDNDGIDNVGIVSAQDDGNLNWTLALGGGGGFEGVPTTNAVFGRPGDHPVVGDWDGNGTSNLGLVRAEGNGQARWILSLDEITNVTVGGPTIDFVFGNHDDDFVVGDWDGDGDDNAGVVRKTDDQLEWHLNHNSDSLADEITHYGKSSDIPISGKWRFPDAQFETLDTTPPKRDRTLMVDMGDVPRGNPLAKNFRIINTGNAPAGDIRDFGGPSLRVTELAESIAPMAHDDFVITFASDVLGAFENEILVVGSNNDKLLSMNLSGEVIKAPPALEIISLHDGEAVKIGGDLPFGRLNVGDARSTMTLGLTNRGEEPLMVSDIQITGDFTLTNAPPKNDIATGNSFNLSVAAEVSTVGVKKGLLSITHNDPLLPNPAEVEFTGLVGNVLYLSFDGVTISRETIDDWSRDWSDSSTEFLDSVETNVIVDPLYDQDDSRATLVRKIIEFVQEDLRPFKVDVQRLDAGQEIVERLGVTTIFVGNSNLIDQKHVAGDIDIGNDNGTDIAFVAEEDWGTIDRTALALSNVVLHEYGHSVGLFHSKELRNEKGQEEAMGFGSRYPLADATFMDVTLPILGEEGETQNSFQFLSQLFGSGGTEIFFGKPQKLLGDIDGDRCVCFSDFLILADNFGKDSDGAPIPGDLNADGAVGFQDFLILSGNFGKELIFFLLDDVQPN